MSDFSVYSYELFLAFSGRRLDHLEAIGYDLRKRLTVAYNIVMKEVIAMMKAY